MIVSLFCWKPSQAFPSHSEKKPRVFPWPVRPHASWAASPPHLPSWSGVQFSAPCLMLLWLCPRWTLNMALLPFGPDSCCALCPGSSWAGNHLGSSLTSFKSWWPCPRAFLSSSPALCLPIAPAPSNDHITVYLVSRPLPHAWMMALQRQRCLFVSFTRVSSAPRRTSGT